MTPVHWSDEADDVMRSDLTAVLSYLTPARGAVPTAVAPLGLADRERGIVTFSTSLGFGKKLERIRRDPKVALAYHAREHGLGGGGTRYVLVQGDATYDATPDREWLEEMAVQVEPFMGPPRRGRLFWDRWLQEYYTERVRVDVAVRRVVTWPDLRCAGEPRVDGEPLPTEPPPPQDPPAKGTRPRVDVGKASRRLLKLPHAMLTWRGADGYPVVVPVDVGEHAPGGIVLRASDGLVPPGGRRAGLMAHRYNAQLIGLATRQHTGWLEAGEQLVYAPHTAGGFAAPAQKTLLLLANGGLAKVGMRKARKQGPTA